VFAGDQAIAAIALVGIVFIPIGLACMAASNKVCLRCDVSYINL